MVLVVAAMASGGVPAENGVGSSTWEDPSAGPFREDVSSTWFLAVLNLNDLRCGGAKLGFGDFEHAKAIRSHFLARGGNASRMGILLDGGSAGYPMASEQNLKQWLAAAATEANREPEARLLVMLAGHGASYVLVEHGQINGRNAGSWICLNGYPLNGKMPDHRFGTYLSYFAPHVQVGVLVSCSLCGGFADRIVGPVDTWDSAETTGSNRVVAVGCSMVTECFGDNRYDGTGSVFFRLWREGLSSGAADGWTGIAGEGAMLPYDSHRRDGRITFEESYWWALWQSARDTIPYPGIAAAQRFQLRDDLVGGFVLSSGGATGVANAGTGGCTVDDRDYDGDGRPNAVDVVNDVVESRASVEDGGYVETHTITSPTSSLVVTSPSGRQATFITYTKNISLDVFAGEPVDGTWTFEQRSTGPLNPVRKVALSGKTIEADGWLSAWDVGTLAWNWHADSRTDETFLVDVDPCPASGLRVYVAGVTSPG